MILSLQNMKQYLFIIAISILPYTLIAQEPDGAYLNEQDSIVFSDDRLIFRISGFAGLSAAQVGEGEYQIIDNYILIHTADYSGNKSSFQELDGTREDTCVVPALRNCDQPQRLGAYKLRAVFKQGNELCSFCLI